MSRLCKLSIGVACSVGVIVLAVQLLLWWILYQTPQWANQF